MGTKETFAQGEDMKKEKKVIGFLGDEYDEKDADRQVCSSCGNTEFVVDFFPYSAIYGLIIRMRCTKCGKDKWEGYAE